MNLDGGDILELAIQRFQGTLARLSDGKGRNEFVVVFFRLN